MFLSSEFASFFILREVAGKLWILDYLILDKSWTIKIVKTEELQIWVTDRYKITIDNSSAFRKKVFKASLK